MFLCIFIIFYKELLGSAIEHAYRNCSLCLNFSTKPSLSYPECRQSVVSGFPVSACGRPQVISAALICRTLETSGTQGIPFFSDCTNFNVRDKILGSPHSDIDILQFSSDTF